MTEAARLLPISASEQEASMEQATARIERVPVPIKNLWNPQTIGQQQLPWLAWAFCVPIWDPEWDLQKKRDATSSSLYVLKHRGTPSALITGLSAVFKNNKIQEWFQELPARTPYTFRMLLEVTDQPLEKTQLFKMADLAYTVKNLRSHLSSIDVSAKSQAHLYVSAGACVGISLTVGEPPPLPVLYLDGSWTLDGSQILDGFKR